MRTSRVTSKWIAAGFLAVSSLASGCAAAELGDGRDYDDIAEGEDIELASQESNLYVLSTKTWGQGARISVCFETANFTTEKSWIRDAVWLSWEAASSVRFTGWADCTASGADVRILLQDSRASSKVGTLIKNKASGMKLNTWQSALCRNTWTREDCVRSTAVHEFGHALGFVHEQERTDTPATCTEDNTQTEGDTTVGAWDIDSVMNYCNPERNGRGILSFYDARGVRKFYGDNGWATDPLLFDPQFYLSRYPDLAAAYGPTDTKRATEHWVSAGLAREGRRGTRAFDVQFYRSNYPDLNNAYGNRFGGLAHHWLAFYGTEGRRGSREFDVQWYLSKWPDLKNAFGTNYRAALDHWLVQGLPVEGRAASASFDVSYYLNAYADLRAAFGYDYRAGLLHWLQFGISEGRRGAP